MFINQLMNLTNNNSIKTLIIISSIIVTIFYLFAKGIAYHKNGYGIIKTYCPIVEGFVKFRKTFKYGSLYFITLLPLIVFVPAIWSNPYLFVPICFITLLIRMILKCIVEVRFLRIAYKDKVGKGAYILTLISTKLAYIFYYLKNKNIKPKMKMIAMTLVLIMSMTFILPMNSANAATTAIDHSYNAEVAGTFSKENSDSENILPRYPMDELPEDTVYYSGYRDGKNGTLIHCLFAMQPRKNGSWYVCALDLHSYGISKDCEICNENKKKGYELASYINNGVDPNVEEGYNTFNCNYNYLHPLDKLTICQKGTENEYYICKKCGTIFLTGKNFSSNPKAIEKFIGKTVEQYSAEGKVIFLEKENNKQVLISGSTIPSTFNSNVLTKKVKFNSAVSDSSNAKNNKNNNNNQNNNNKQNKNQTQDKQTSVSITQPKDKNVGNDTLYQIIDVKENQYADKLLPNEKFYDTWAKGNNNTIIHVLYGQESQKYVKIHTFGIEEEECISCRKALNDNQSFDTQLYKNAYNAYKNTQIDNDNKLDVNINDYYNYFNCNNNYKNHNLLLDQMEVFNEGTIDEYYVCPKCGYTLLSGVNFYINSNRFIELQNMSLEEYVENKGCVYLLLDSYAMSEAGKYVSQSKIQEISKQYENVSAKRKDDNSNILVRDTKKQEEQTDELIDNDKNSNSNSELNNYEELYDNNENITFEEVSNVVKNMITQSETLVEKDDLTIKDVTISAISGITGVTWLKKSYDTTITLIAVIDISFDFIDNN